MNHARRGCHLYNDATDYQLFIDLLRDTAGLFNVRIAAFCLMPNHYHLLVQTPRANLSRNMRHINGIYTQKYNIRHSCDGTLFRGRYKSILIEADSYLLQLVRYIHNNPIKAGLVKRVEQYLWSSHKGYLTNEKKWDWLYKDFVLAIIAPSPDSRIKAYRHYMAQDEDDKLVSVFQRPYLPSILGEESYISGIKERFFKKKRDRQVPDSKNLAPEIDDILVQVCNNYNVNQDELRRVRRGMINEPRDVAIYLIRILRAEPLMRIGPFFNLNHYSSVSSAVMRIKKRERLDRILRDRLRKIQKNIMKGQTEI